MKGFHFTSGCYLIIVTLLTLQSQMTFASYSMSETCAHLRQGYIANPDDCQSYGYCSNGALIGTKKCDPGLLYDANKGQCNYAANVKCSTKLASTCANIDSPVYVADPDDCTRACYCNGNGKYTCVSCPSGQYYNPNQRACVWPKDYSCPASSICRLVPDDTFVSDPDACGNYISCFGGSGLSTSCGDGSWFNPMNGNCENVNICQGNAVTPQPGIGLGVQNNLPNNKTACSEFLTPQNGTSYFVSDKKTCMGYYVCNNNTGPGTWFKCEMGTHFSQEKQKCVTPYTIDCPHDRCANINQRYVTAIKSGCSSYLYCENETDMPGNGNSCEVLNPNYPWFDEFTGYCVDTKPDYDICKLP